MNKNIQLLNKTIKILKNAQGFLKRALSLFTRHKEDTLKAGTRFLAFKVVECHLCS